MAPIRIGFIGLSKSGWAKTAHFTYLNDTDSYQIVAICNSSVESSKEAIAAYGLPGSTKAYGNPQDVANDKDVDLVVCSVRVDRHFSTISPSLKAGKNVYVEWPLGKNLVEAKELLRLKNESGVKIATVGLQGRRAPIVKKLRDLVEGGKIGGVLSSIWTGQAGNGGGTTTEGIEYLGRREVGGNLVTIHFGHGVDYVQHVLGYDFQSPPKTLLANQRKTVKLLDSQGKVLEETHPKTSDDTIFLHGILKSGIPISMSLRGGQPFKGTPGLDWRIYGDKGEIRVTASGPFLQVGYPDIKVEVHDTENDTLEEVQVEKDEFDTEKFAIPARNVARLYKGLAKGEINCSFEDAVERHALIERMYKENGIQE